MVVSENLMQFIWKLRLFNRVGLRTSAGTPLAVVRVGQHNTDAGPDFVLSHIILADEEWVGNIEIHFRSSDWNRHLHQYDEAYNNVILHVVWIEDQIIYRSDGSVIPTLVLSEYVRQDLLDKYANMMRATNWLPCQSRIGEVEELKKDMWLDALSVERLEVKAEDIFGLLAQFNSDWEKVFWVWMCRCMGLKVNADTFQELGEKLPLATMQKYRSDGLKIEALLFGIAGFLTPECADQYMQRLYHEFAYQQAVHGIRLVNGVWKKLRMRPYNFPELRIAQLVALFTEKSLSLSKVLTIQNLAEARLLFDISSINSYWKSRFSIGASPGIERSGKIGKATVDILVINTVVLMLFAYGKYYGIHPYMDRAIALLEAMPAEKNAIIKQFAHLGWRATNASQGQGMLQLKKHYCDRKQCLKCRIGTEILRN